MLYSDIATVCALRKDFNHRCIVNLDVTAMELEAHVPGSLPTVADVTVLWTSDDDMESSSKSLRRRALLRRSSLVGNQRSLGAFQEILSS